MGKYLAIAIAIFFAGTLAHAQIPSGNIFLGYSFSQTGNGGATQNLNGWEGSLEGKIIPWVGIVADFSAGYGTDNALVSIACSPLSCPHFSSTVRRYTYLVGPRLSLPIGRFTPFVHALFGAAHINDQGNTDTAFANAIGGGLDYKLIKGIALRLQGDNVHTKFFGDSQNNLRFSAGIDLRF
ncbi:MAG TPA: outer membrane beta-barrel protein [Terriglobales bacterium]|nr:outer membrane beta-barrel protein [Terriglobales bacterium]